MPTTRTRFVALSFAAAFVACDAPTREEVAGLQQRLDTLAAENTESRTKIGTLTDDLEKANKGVGASNERADALQVRLDQLEAKVAGNTTSIAALEVKPAAAARPVAAGRPDPALRYRVDVGDAQVEGAKDAKVTVVVFSDFQCPFCARVQSTLDEVQKDYGSDVRVVAKHNPLGFHTNAEPAARAAEAAGKQGKFWEMHDKLYANIKALGVSEIEGYAKDLGLDVARFRKDMDSKDVIDRIEANKAQAKELGAAGTPSFFINGRYLSGAQPKESFKTLIDSELANADKVIAGGTSRAVVYDEIMKTAILGPGAGK